MNINSLQRVILAVAQSEGLDSVLQKIVRGLAGERDVALTRIWLVAPGDICVSCPLKSVCLDQARCLHLVASAGNPLIEPGFEDGTRPDWTRINGHFRRIPLNTPFNLGHVVTTGEPVHVRIQDGGVERLWSSRPDWVKAQKILTFANYPLIFKGEALGALAVFSRSELSERELERLRAFADLAVLAISNAHVTEQFRAPHASAAAMAERWRAVFEKSAIGVALTDEKGRFLDVNRAYENVLGYTKEELRNLSFFDITPEEFRESNRGLATELWAGSLEQYQFEKPYLRKDGELVWVRLHASLVPGAGSVPRFALALCEDITERKRAEESLRKSEERWRTLLEINNAMITNLSQEALLRSIVEALRRFVPFDRAALTLYLPEKDVFRFVAIEGSDASDYFRPGLEISPQESSVGWVFHHQRPILRRDLEKEQQYSNERRLAREGMRSHCVVPLIVRGRSIGTLNVASNAQNQYSEEASDFLQEVANQVALAVENMKSYEEIATLKARLQEENIYLQEEIRTEHNFEEIVGNSPALLKVLQAVEQVAPTDSTVLIHGETGTGKELIARAIHNRSTRKDRPLLRVDCGAIPAGLVESELFGHMKGAFTGAYERRTGRFELADGGTIFLDEIGELPPEIQAKLLRVLQEHEFERVGSSHSQRVDVRVIAATNRNLEEAVKAGGFRADLFYRLNVFPLQVPPLRDRRSDIPQLVTFYLSRSAKKFSKRVDTISRGTMDRLVNYPWPGNVRELQNVIERAVILSPGSALLLDQNLVPGPSLGRSAEKSETPGQDPLLAEAESPRLPTLEEADRAHILAALQQTGGVIEGPKGAATILNLHPNTLRHRMQKLGIRRPRHRRR
ncbi:MAG: sigma 54-interacting transcriptional regulator [Acidobacteriia bacterium]|nr:sigma 54-interacting transcriptional regulator [Terriglobia bacterium]